MGVRYFNAVAWPGLGGRGLPRRHLPLYVARGASQTLVVIDRSVEAVGRRDRRAHPDGRAPRRGMDRLGGDARRAEGIRLGDRGAALGAPGVRVAGPGWCGGGGRAFLPVLRPADG